MSDSTRETIIVRDRDSLRQLPASDAWTTMTLVGALSADPRTFDELARAWLRYQPETPLDDLPWAECAGPPAADPWLLLDLACLRVVAGGGAELPENQAAFQRDEGPWHPQMPVVWINLPPDWECLAAETWQQALPPLPIAAEPLDVRGVLFGRALAEGIARRTLEIAARQPLPDQHVSWDHLPLDTAANQAETARRWRELTVQLHADWLTTPREDLEGQPPRTFLHRGREWVERELNNRQRQWSIQGSCPQPLDTDTFAYRYGPLGRHEVVMYFDLCRELFAAAWERIVAEPQIELGAMTEHLHSHARQWLAEASIDDDPTPPAVIIEHERRRMPLVGGEHVIDCDCPLCRMEAEQGMGPMFHGFDGYHLELDQEFAFSLCATREQWEQEQEEYRRWSEEIDAQRREREAAGEDPLSSVWKSSYVDDEALEGTDPFSPLAMMALGVRVAELVGDLRRVDDGQELICCLNRDFDAYRDAADEAAMVAATQPLAETLEQIAAAHPHLTDKAADLQSQLDERQRQLAAGPDPDR